MAEPGARVVRCPMGDWAQVAPTREAAIALMSRHIQTSHRTDDGAPQWAIDRADARLADLGVTYVPPDGRYVPPAEERR